MAEKNQESPIQITLQEVLKRIESMTPEEFKESLQRAGVVDQEGKLTPPYQKGS
jgi:hypothetical protein